MSQRWIAQSALVAAACLWGVGPVDLTPCWAASHPVAQVSAEELESRARALLDTPLLATGDWRATMDGVLRFLREQPDHPLAGAAWSLLASRQETLGEPLPLAQALAQGALPISQRPDAFRVQERLTGQLRVDFAPGIAALEAISDPYPSYLSAAWVRGPLPPRTRTLAVGSEPQRLQQPGVPLDNLYGDPAPWRSAPRPRLQPHVAAYETLREELGHAQVGFAFNVPETTEVWLEIEARFPRAAAPWRGEGFDGGSARYSFSIDGGAPEQVDLSLNEGQVRRLVPLQVEAGLHWIVLETSLESQARGRFGIRILGRDGLPMAGIGTLDPATGQDPFERAHAASERLDLAPPSDWQTSLGVLRSARDATEIGPYGRALMGILLLLEDRPMEGLGYLRQAYEQAPEEDALATVLSTATLLCGHLPETYRRSSSRELVTRVVERNPGAATANLMLIDTLAGEDREEEALAALEELGALYPEAVDVYLVRCRILRAMGLPVIAEQALARAQELEPDSLRVLLEHIAQARGMGQTRKALELRLQAVRLGGAQLDDLERAARGLIEIGRVDEALELHREMELRSPNREAGHIAALMATERFEEVTRRLEERIAERPRDGGARRVRADLALELGEAELEADSLRSALELRPWSASLRERLADRGSADAARILVQEQLTDVDAARAGYDSSLYDESLVFVIDESVRYFFEDGSSEQVTQNLYHVKDLEGVEALTKLNLSNSDVLELATIEPDGRRLEPIEVAGEYVLPSLDPGDFVHVVTRVTGAAPGDGIVRPEGWFFASTDEPFHFSRFAISLPASLGLRFVEDNLADVEKEERTASDGRRFLSYTARQQRRVHPEAGMPGRAEFLPNVNLGQDEDELAVLEFHAAEAAWYSHVTPELTQVARTLCRGIDNRVDQARALHAGLKQLLDERSVQPLLASHSLFLRRGNASFLYRALLRAAGFDAELVWSRSIAPAEDDRPDPDYLSLDRMRRRLLVVVRIDGAEYWCDPMVDFLPFGQTMGQAPGAEALFAESSRWGNLPTAPLSERPSMRVRAELKVDTAGDGQLTGRVDFLAGFGYLFKKQARDIPESQLKLGLRSLAAQRLPGFQLEVYQLPGLDSETEPLRLEGTGRLPGFVDRRAGAPAAKLPLVPFDLTAQFAGEGARRLPFHMAQPMVEDVEILLIPPTGQNWAPFEAVELRCPGGSYSLSMEPRDEGRYLLKRKVAIDAFRLEAQEYSDFLAFCRAVDNAEDVRLRLQ